MVVTKRSFSTEKKVKWTVKDVVEMTYIGAYVGLELLGIGAFFVGRGIYRGFSLFGKYAYGKLVGFDNNFSKEEKKLLKKNNAWPYVVNKFSKNYSAKQIIDFNKIMSSKHLIMDSVVYKYDIKSINEYSEYFSLKEAYKLYAENLDNYYTDMRVPVQFARHLKNRFDIEQIVELFTEAESELTSPGASPQYGKTFDTEKTLDVYFDIMTESEDKLYKIIADAILSYDKKYDAKDISNFLNKQLDSEKVKEYPFEYSGLEINLIYDLGIEPTSPLHENKKELLKYAIHNIEKETSSFFHKKFIASGNEGIIILDKGPRESDKSIAYKIGYDLTNEFSLLRKIHSEQPNCQNIVKYTGSLRSGQFDILPLEYIETIPLFRENHSEETIVKDLYNILNGVRELRISGVYHNDLHENNILRKKQDNNVIIADLNSGTLTPENEKALNRNYSNNDLIAIGLLGYKMYAGYNLFNENNEQSNLSVIKNMIQSERVAVYNDRKLLESKFDQIKKEIDGGLADSIIYLLDRDLYIQPELPEVDKALRFVRNSV